MKVCMSLCSLAVVLALLVPGSLAQGDITPASAQVLQASYLAANLSELAYPSTFLSATDAIYTNTQPALDQAYKAALNSSITALGLNLVGFVDRYSAAPGTNAPDFIKTRFLHAFVATKPAAGSTPATVHVVFRGTDLSPVSINTDAETRQTAVTGSDSATVHEGFYLSLTETPGYIYDNSSYTQQTSAYDDIKSLIVAAQALPDIGAGAVISLTGHSLGAGEAAMCAYLLQADGLTNIALTTFGLPQLGNQAWRELFGQVLAAKHTRWWNMDDPIVKTPNSKVDPGIFYGSQDWFTVDTLYRIDSVDGVLKCGVPSGSFTVCDARKDSSAPTNSQSCFLDNPLNLSGYELFKQALASFDHRITSYKANLLTCLTAAGEADGTMAAASAAAVPASGSTGARRLLRGSI